MSDQERPEPLAPPPSWGLPPYQVDAARVSLWRLAGVCWCQTVTHSPECHLHQHEE
jgi:hypothetical protein